MLTVRITLGYLAIVLVIAAALMTSGFRGTGQAQSTPVPSLLQLPSFGPPDQPVTSPAVQPATLPADQSPAQRIIPPTDQPALTPTPSILGPSFDPQLDIKAGPVALPLELLIPSLNITAPIIGVGLTSGNVMDAPEGPIGDPIWQTAFWYRGSGIPGESGTATIGAHVDDQLGRPQLFAHLQDLRPGDLIYIYVKNTAIDILFVIDQVSVYSLKESSDPAVLNRIYGAGPMAGTGPQPSLDGLSHLTLITCEGNWVNGQFDHHTVVYATRSN